MKRWIAMRTKRVLAVLGCMALLLATLPALNVHAYYSSCNCTLDSVSITPDDGTDKPTGEKTTYTADGSTAPQLFPASWNLLPVGYLDAVVSYATWAGSTDYTHPGSVRHPIDILYNFDDSGNYVALVREAAWPAANGAAIDITGQDDVYIKFVLSNRGDTRTTTALYLHLQRDGISPTGGTVDEVFAMPDTLDYTGGEVIAVANGSSFPSTGFALAAFDEDGARVTSAIARISSDWTTGSAYLTLPRNNSATAQIYTLKANVGGVWDDIHTGTVTVAGWPQVSRAVLDPTQLTHTGGSVDIELEGTQFPASFDVRLIDGNTVGGSGTATGNDTTATASLTLPANTGYVIQSYYLQVSFDSGTTWEYIWREVQVWPEVYLQGMSVSPYAFAPSGGTAEVTLTGSDMPTGIWFALFDDAGAKVMDSDTPGIGSGAEVTCELGVPANDGNDDAYYSVRVSMDGGTNYLEEPYYGITVYKKVTIDAIAANPDTLDPSGGSSDIGFEITDGFDQCFVTLGGFVNDTLVQETETDGNFMWWDTPYSVTMDFPANTTAASIEYTVKVSQDGGITWQASPTTTVTVAGTATVTSVAAGTTSLPAAGGNSLITVAGTDLPAGVQVAVFDGSDAMQGTAETITGGATGGTATLDFPANNTISAIDYTIKVSLDGGSTWLAAPTATVAVAGTAKLLVPSLANASNNRFSVSGGLTQTAGVAFVITATGDRQDAAGSVAGDTRFVPVRAAANPTIDFVDNANGSYTASMEISKPGDYILTVWFQLERWDGSAWQSTNTTDMKKADLTVLDNGSSGNSGGNSSSTSSGGAGNEETETSGTGSSPRVGDDTNLFGWLLLGGMALAAVSSLILLKRKRVREK